MKRALVLGILAACGAHGQMRVDTPVPYNPPDISDITGIDEDDASESDSGSATPTPAPAPAAATPASGTAPAPKPAGK